MWNKVVYRFYKTWIGNKYLTLLLWFDRKYDMSKIATQKELIDITIQAQKILYKEGITKIKRRVSSLMKAKTPSEYDTVMRSIEDLVPLAERDSEHHKNMVEVLRKAYVFKDKDIKSASDFAKMIDRRINDYSELKAHKAKRELMRSIRASRKSGDKDQAAALEQKFKETYGKRR